MAKTSYMHTEIPDYHIKIGIKDNHPVDIDWSDCKGYFPKGDHQEAFKNMILEAATILNKQSSTPLTREEPVKIDWDSIVERWYDSPLNDNELLGWLRVQPEFTTTSEPLKWVNIKEYGYPNELPGKHYLFVTIHQGIIVDQYVGSMIDVETWRKYDMKEYTHYLTLPSFTQPEPPTEQPKRECSTCFDGDKTPSWHNCKACWNGEYFTNWKPTQQPTKVTWPLDSVEREAQPEAGEIKCCDIPDNIETIFSNHCPPGMYGKTDKIFRCKVCGKTIW